MRSTIRSFFVLIIVCPLISLAQGGQYLDDMLDRYYSTADNRKVYIQTDKYLYEANESVWITGLILDRRTHQKTSDAITVYLSLEKDNGDDQIWLDLQSRDGYLKGKIRLPEDFDEGAYFLRARFDRKKRPVFQKEIMVKKDVIPFFVVNGEFQHKYYGAGERVSVRVSAKGYDNRPLKSASFEAKVSNGANAILEFRGKLSKVGVADIGFVLPENLSDAGLQLKVSVKEKQATENIVMEIPYQDHAVGINFYPEGKNLVHGVINRMTFKAADKYGYGFPFEGKVVTMEGVEISTIKSDKDGSGTFSFKPHANQPLKVVITSPYRVKKEFELPPVNTTGATIVLAGDEGDHLLFRVFKNLMKTSHFNVAVIHRGRKVHFVNLDLKNENLFQLPKDVLRPGINQITLFDSLMVPLSELLHYVPLAGSSANISIADDIYRLRQRVDVNVTSKKTLQLAFSASDQFRLRRDRPSQNISSYLLIDSELSGAQTLGVGELESGKMINDELKYQCFITGWDDIFAVSDKSVTYNTFVMEGISVPQGSLYHKKLSEGVLRYTNFDYDNYYAAINPFLQQQLPKSPEHIPPYKEQLQSGVEVRKALYTIKPYNVIANNSIVFYGSQTSLLYPDGALIVIDGVRCGTNINTLDNLSPYNVEEMKVSTNPVDIMNYTALNSVGVIEIITKRNEKDEEELSDDEEFSAPVYAEEEWRRAVKGRSDFRTTLQWIPFREVREFPANIEVYQSDIYNKITGIVEGVDANGNPFYGTFQYTAR